ncbi:MAG: VacJ family lipoprotein [Deltaproteobacteria bacterium]|nr:VacJ family lipoprotein [Deltaproteobacteria bacterium]
MGSIHRLWFILILGVICWGIGCARGTGWAATVGSPIDSGGQADVLERNMAGHELVRTARLDEDVAKTGAVNHEAPSTAEKPSLNAEKPEAGPEDGYPDETLYPDPLEPMNRAFFKFNDVAYSWFFKPVAEGYSAVMPDVMRLSIRNFFTNLSMPVRLVSSLLQGKMKSVGIILVRFMVNSSAGFLGFQDVARQALNYPVQDEDLGQAFAFYGIGPGFYLNLPFLGASSLRDTVGWVGSLYLNPLDYILEDWVPNLSTRAFNIVNNTSLRIGEYEALKDASLDPYVAMRDAYFQYRQNQIEK